MKCEKIGILLSAHVDKEVTEQERRLVENHLEVCEDCKRSVSAFFEVHRLYRDMPVAEPLPGFRQRVTHRLEREPRLSLFEGWWRQKPLAYITSFALIVLMGGIVLLQGVKKPDLQAVDVYAEDILFGQVESTVDDLFTLERTSVTDEIVEMFYFDEADNNSLFENEPLSSDGRLYIS